MARIKRALSSICEFKEKCKYYSKDSFTCNKEPGGYCGAYRNFEKQWTNKNLRQKK